MASSWDESVSPHWFDELPFFVAAAIGYGALFLANPQIRWGSRERAPDAAVPIEFVASLPAPSPNLAPALGGGDDRTPRLGPGDYVPEKIRAGAPDAPPKPHPSPKPAPLKPHPHPKHAAVAKAAPPAPAVPRRPAPDPAAVAAAREAAKEKAARVAAAAEAKREAAAERAAALAETRREAAAAKAAARAEAKRQADALAEVKREAAAEKAAAAKAAAEKRAAAERERRRQLAAARAAEAKRKAALSQQLATMSDPDEALDAAQDSGSAAASTGKTVSDAKSASVAAGAAAPAGAAGDGLAGARKASAAAALADAADPSEPGDAAGRGGADLLDAKATGGGSGPDGSGVSWTMDGPVGSRRVLKRSAPTSPDWVGARGLDLTVTVRFQVLPDGRIKPGSVIQKTSGFPEIDKRALDALKKWRFEAADGAPETWGRVTFRFTSA
jgi:TonB family protein